jgi:hypothetical protein
VGQRERYLGKGGGDSVLVNGLAAQELGNVESIWPAAFEQGGNRCVHPVGLSVEPISKLRVIADGL